MELALLAKELMNSAGAYAFLAKQHLTAPDPAAAPATDDDSQFNLQKEFLMTRFLFPELKPDVIHDLCRLRWYRWFHQKQKETASAGLSIEEEFETARVREYSEAEFASLTEKYERAFADAGPTPVQREIFRIYYAAESP